MTILHLTKQQASVLSIILDLVGGSPSKSGRKYSDEIRRQLMDQEASHSIADEETYPVKCDEGGYVAGIFFEETK